MQGCINAWIVAQFGLQILTYVHLISCMNLYEIYGNATIHKRIQIHRTISQNIILILMIIGAYLERLRITAFEVFADKCRVCYQ